MRQFHIPRYCSIFRVGSFSSWSSSDVTLAISRRFARYAFYFLPLCWRFCYSTKSKLWWLFNRSLLGRCLSSKKSRFDLLPLSSFLKLQSFLFLLVNNSVFSFFLFSWVVLTEVTWLQLQIIVLTRKCVMRHFCSLICHRRWEIVCILLQNTDGNSAWKSRVFIKNFSGSAVWISKLFSPGRCWF